MNAESINNVTKIAAFVILLAGSFILGWLGKPTEMGLSILAAAIALAFTNIEKIKRFKGAGFEAEMLERKVEAIIAKDAEPQPVSESPKVKPIGLMLDEVALKVVKALGNSKYTWRTVDGICTETGQSATIVRSSLQWLSGTNLAIQTSIGSLPHWGLSEEGRAFFNQHNW